MSVLPTSASCRPCHTEKNCLEIPSRSIYNNQMDNRDGTLTGPNHRLGHKLLFAAAAILALMTIGAKAEAQSAKGDKLPVAPSLSDNGSSASKKSVSANKPSTTRKKGIPANVWTSPPPVVAYSASYWNVLDIDDSAGGEGNGATQKFRYTSPSYGSASSIDKIKLGDSYLGIDTQRRLQTRTPSGKADCATDEECEDYSVMPRSRSRASVGTSSSSSLIRSRKPFFGLSVTTPIE